MFPKVKIVLWIAKTYSGIVTVAILIIISTLLGGCRKSSSVEVQPIGTTETLRFVWMADSRGDSLGDPVNTPVMKAIIGQITKLSPKPLFVVFGGDMSYRGFIDNKYTFRSWKDLYQPVFDSGIALYTCVGNHELYHQHASEGSWRLNQDTFKVVFSENPGNGPAGYEHLTWSFTHPGSGSFFAALDPYYLYKDTMHLKLGGNIDSIQMAWLELQVAQSSALHKFLFIHTPYYYMSNDPEEPSSSNETDTKMWSLIDANKFDIYFCGHSHLYSRRTIDSSLHPTPQTLPPTNLWQNNVVQLLNGTCGAGPSVDSTLTPDTRAAWNVHNDPLTFYFSVIDVTGNTVTVNSYRGYTGTYYVFDTFTIVK
ncbi:MAG: metallophosphoesterase [Bacteroidetes bacterium]|nr:metallophosphoesterase [Bacteroidota bacterium]